MYVALVYYIQHMPILMSIVGGQHEHPEAKCDKKLSRTPVLALSLFNLIFVIPLQFFLNQLFFLSEFRQKRVKWQQTHRSLPLDQDIFCFCKNTERLCLMLLFVRSLIYCLSLKIFKYVICVCSSLLTQLWGVGYMNVNMCKL